MWCQRTILVFLCPCVVIAFAISSFAQEEKKGPELKAKFHQDFRGGDPANPNLRPIRDGNLRWESGGARITIPAGTEKIPTTGLSANFKIKGDFEITASYEILKADTPTEGYGVGVSLFVAIEPNTLDAVSLARRVTQKGNSIFMSDRMKPDDAKEPHFVKVKASTAPAGRLRIQREGAMVRFFVAEGGNPEFIVINQGKGKNVKDEVAFGADEIRYFQFGGDAGESLAALDVRLIDLSVQAEELPGLIEVAAPKRAAPPWNPAPSANASGSSDDWLSMLPMVGIAAALVLALVLGVVLMLRRRAAHALKPAAVDEKESTPAEAPARIPFVCPDCGQKLKVNAKLAGKKIRCPECGKSSLVPPAKIKKTGQTSA